MPHSVYIVSDGILHIYMYARDGDRAGAVAVAGVELWKNINSFIYLYNTLGLLP